MEGSPQPSPAATSRLRRSGVPGPLVLGIQGDSDARLLPPSDGVAASAGGIGSPASMAGERLNFALGDIPNASSLIGLSVNSHEDRGIKRAGYRFRADLELTMLLLLDTR